MELVSGGLVYPHFQVMSNELSTPKILVCPQDRKRLGATNFLPDLRDIHVSYFVGLDATEETPAAMLCGDRNILTNSVAAAGLIWLKTNSVVSWSSKIHRNQGNVLLADGTVNMLTTSALQARVHTNGPSIRLAMGRD